MLSLESLLTYYLQTENLIGQVEMGKKNHKKQHLGPSLFCPEAFENKPNQVKNIMAPTTPPFKFNPSLRLLHSTREGGGRRRSGCGHVGQEKAWEKAPGGLQTLKISNNFGAPGRRVGRYKLPLGQAHVYWPSGSL